MKIKVKVSYPWHGIEDDKEIIEIEDGMSSDEIEKVIFDIALDMIFNRGVEWDYEILE
jgi:hypothetical protein